MIHFLEHIILHTLEDTLKLLPFLFLVFWAMEVMEHGFGHKSQAVIEKAGYKVTAVTRAPYEKKGLFSFKK